MAAACSAHCSIAGRLNPSPFALPRTATSAIFSFKPSGRNRLCVRAKVETDDCNEEACAPEKEVGKVSMEWVAEEKTQVVGTYPPVSRKWTGYVEKDTAGQTNIYSVEPTVYVADSAISSGEAGISSQGSQQTATIAISLGVVMLAGVSVVLSQVGNSSPTAESFEYSGPSLSYYIKKFSAPLITETLAPPDIQNAPAPEVSPSISEVSGQGFQSQSGPSTGA